MSELQQRTCIPHPPKDSVSHDIPSGFCLDSSTDLTILGSLLDTAHRALLSTILLIHGATGDGSNWKLVTPHLTNYHLLIPDLPGHGIARNQPFSVAQAASALHALILKRAHNSVAYVVGFSLGAHVAMHLVSHYPEIADCVLVSGFQVFPRTKMSPYLPYAVWLEQRFEYAIPRSWVRWAMDGIDIPRPDLTMCTAEYNRQVFGSGDDIKQWPKPWPARTLVIAAGKGGLVPSNDRPEDAKKLARIGREQNSATRAVTHLDMRHPWIWQDPELFAETVKRWLEEGTVPDGFLPL
ncbi:alpha/beta-hydrolase [Aureobasidium subglaciale]|nr:alpha/beta-hydrolase [Aureobasidium subglaciale]